TVQMRPALADDALHAKQTAALLDGKWLGDYDRFTLVKEPGYALFLAASRSIGLTRRLAEDLFLALAALMTAWGLRRLGLSRSVSAVLFLILLFAPWSFGEVCYRLSRDGVHASQCLALVGLAGGLCSELRPRWRAVAAIAFGLIVAWTSITRAEALWLAPAGVVAVLAWLVTSRAREGSWGRAVFLTLLMAAPAVVTTSGLRAWVRAKNEAVYGRALITELEAPEFEAAVGALRRVAQASWRPREPLAQKTLNALYPHAPSLAQLAPVLDSPAWRAPGMIDDRGDRIMIFLTWAMREAAAVKGHHVDLPTALAFYATVAQEVNAAVAAGLVPGGERLTSQVPSPDRRLLRRGILRAWRELAESWRMEDARLNGLPRLPRDLVNDTLRQDYLATLGRDPNAVSPRILETSAWLRAWRRFLAIVYGAAPLLGMAATATQAALFFRGRRDPLFAMEAIAATVWVSRGFLTAFLQTHWFLDVGSYHTPMHAVFPLWLGLSLHAYARFPGVRRYEGAWERRCSASPWLPAAATILILVTGGIGFAKLTETTMSDLVLVESDRILPQTACVVMAPRGTLHVDAEASVFDSPRPGTVLSIHVIRPSDTLGQTLTLRGAMPRLPYGDPWRVRWIANGSVRERLIFAGDDDQNTWRVPLESGTTENIELSYPLPGAAALRIERLALEPLASGARFDSEACRADLQFDRATGQLTITLRDAEPQSLYQFFFSPQLMDTPVPYANFEGSVWLDQSTVVQRSEGDREEPLRLRVVTDEAGVGRHQWIVPELMRVDGTIFGQGIGLTHLTKPITVQ
ncbi:MAG: hypothetical protein KDB53_10590, partial [Planctomycetes bacterium]|nr:hypothetical protein [Planctomycetota bacterium]